jgi:hypothetical protein
MVTVTTSVSHLELVPAPEAGLAGLTAVLRRQEAGASARTDGDVAPTGLENYLPSQPFSVVIAPPLWTAWT